MWFDFHVTGRELVLHTATLELGWSRDDGAPIVLRRADGPNLIAHGGGGLSLDLALGTSDGWLSSRAFARFLWHRVEETDERLSVTIAVGLGPLMIFDHYEIAGELISRRLTVENVGLDDLRLCSARLIWPNACVGAPATCRFDAPANSVRPRVDMAVASVQRRSVLPRRFFAPGLRGGSALEPVPSQGPGLLVLHNAEPPMSLLCWYDSAAEAALPFLQGNDGSAEHVSLGHESAVSGWLRPGEQISSGRQYVVVAAQPWPDSSHAYSRYMADRSTDPVDWTRHAPIYVTDARRYGGVRALSDQLAALAALGVRCVNLLPLCEVGNDPHTIRDLERLDPHLGDHDAVRAFVRRAHDLGIHIILDLPLQGASGDSRYVSEHPDWFVRDESGAFVIGASPRVPAVGLHPGVAPPAGRYQLDWQHPDLQQYVFDWAVAQANDLELDGFRAVNAYNPTPTWLRRNTHASAGSMSALHVLARLRPALRGMNPQAALYSTLAGPAFEPCCDALFDYQSHQMFIHAALSRMQPREFGNYLADHRRVVQGGAARIAFMETYDTCTINPLADGLRGSRISRMLLSGMALCGFVPALWSGQEQSDWAAIAALLRLWHGEPALRLGSADFTVMEWDEPGLFSVVRRYESRRLIGLINFSAHTCRGMLPAEYDPHHTVRDLLGQAPIDIHADQGKLQLTLAPFSAYCLEA